MFFFSCDCGSRVLFDALGDPWPLHSERCIPLLIKQLQAEGLSAAHIRQFVEQEADRRGVVVPPAIWKRLRAKEYAEKKQPIFVTVEPGGSEQELTGRILAANLQVNFYNRLQYPKNAMSTGFLGKLVRSSFVELRVREDPDRVTGICAEAECYMLLGQWNALKLAVNLSVSVFLVSHQLPNDRWVWLVDHIARLDRKL